MLLDNGSKVVTLATSGGLVENIRAEIKELFPRCVLSRGLSDRIKYASKRAAACWPCRFGNVFNDRIIDRRVGKLHGERGRLASWRKAWETRRWRCRGEGCASSLRQARTWVWQRWLVRARARIAMRSMKMDGPVLFV